MVVNKKYPTFHDLREILAHSIFSDIAFIVLYSMSVIYHFIYVICSDLYGNWLVWSIKPKTLLIILLSLHSLSFYIFSWSFYNRDLQWFALNCIFRAICGTAPQGGFMAPHVWEIVGRKNPTIFKCCHVIILNFIRWFPQVFRKSRQGILTRTHAF